MNGLSAFFVYLFTPVLFGAVFYGLALGVTWWTAAPLRRVTGSRFFFIPQYTDDVLFSWGAKWRPWRRVELLIHGHEHETHDPVYFLRVGREGMLLRTKEFDDCVDIFFRMMERSKWRLKDGKVSGKGGTLGDRAMKWPPWSLEALGHALAPYRRVVPEAALR